MKRWFAHPIGVGPVPPDDQLPSSARRLTVTSRACCCPASPVFTVIIPAGRGHSRPVDLLLCRHHYQASIVALHAVGAGVYDESGALIMCAEAERQLADREHAPAAA
jgi:hypothetical protein